MKRAGSGDSLTGPDAADALFNPSITQRGAST